MEVYLSHDSLCSRHRVLPTGELLIPAAFRGHLSRAVTCRWGNM